MLRVCKYMFVFVFVCMSFAGRLTLYQYSAETRCHHQRFTIKQNRTERNRKCHGNGNGIPSDQRVCECYLILKDFHTTSKFPPDAQKQTTPCSPHPQSAFYAKQNFCVENIILGITSKKFIVVDKLISMHKSKQPFVAATLPHHRCRRHHRRHTYICNGKIFN